jgi:hypothetical protein
MKIVLACLMCLVLTASQCFAISGGPIFGTSGVSVTGTYAGVFVPRATVIVLDPGPPPVTQTLPPDNSLALFSLSIPSTGIGSGTAVIFRNGITYTGTISASADPDSGVLSGGINGTATFTPTTTTMETFSATGEFQNTRITAGPTSTSSATRIKGKARITYIAVPPSPGSGGDSGGPIRYRVHGFKQSNASS